MLNPFHRVPPRRTTQRGMSMIELMVGTVVGLIIIAGLITLYVSNLTGSRRLMLEARLNQDLRAASDLVCPSGKPA